MIVLDTDILSYFAKLDRLHLLVDLFAVPLFVSPNVQAELRKGVQSGYEDLQPALDLILAGAIEVLTITEAAHAFLPRIGTAPDKGETDSLAYCLAHGAFFATNDRRAYRRGRRLGVRCLHLPALLRLFWLHGALSRNDVQDLVVDMENRLNFSVGDLEEIFRDAPD